jgi:peptidase M23-like protein
MKRIVAALVMLLGAVVWAAGWQWPTDSFSISAGFGQSWSETYSRGMELTGPVQPVFPVSEGDVVYVGSAAGGSVSQLGVVVVVEHDRGFRSFYGHLEEGSTPEPGSHVTESTQIGQIGQTGFASRPTLYFSILDTEAGAYVNPLLLLPTIDDTVDPRVISVFAQNSEALYDLGAGSDLASGEYVILVGCEDRMVRDGEPVAPYAVVVVVDGQEQMSVTHDRIVFADGYPRLYPGPEVGYNGLRASDGSYVGGLVTIPAGRTLIEVIVSDFQGNESSVVIEVSGRP